HSFFLHILLDISECHLALLQGPEALEVLSPCYQWGHQTISKAEALITKNTTRIMCSLRITNEQLTRDLALDNSSIKYKLIINQIHRPFTRYGLAITFPLSLQIQGAYRTLALKYHPDKTRNGNNQMMSAVGFYPFIDRIHLHLCKQLILHCSSLITLGMSLLIKINASSMILRGLQLALKSRRRNPPFVFILILWQSRVAFPHHICKARVRFSNSTSRHLNPRRIDCQPTKHRPLCLIDLFVCKKKKKKKTQIKNTAQRHNCLQGST
ncbi:hypothetical protein VP01_3160g1, partial [Puccinia sorghi]